jgi:WD40 repeat protein
MTTAQATSFDIGAQATSPLLQRAEVRLGANITAATTLDGRAAFALGDGTVRLRNMAREDDKAAFGDNEIVAACHSGAATLLAPFRGGFVSAGQDGRVVRYTGTESGVVPMIDFDGRWVDALAAHEGTARIAAAAGRQIVVAAERGGQVASDAFASTISGLAFAPEGRRLAAAHCDGVSILSAETGAREHLLGWKGAHIGVSWSPDGRFVVSATQERELHVWDLVTLQDLRLGGYPHKIHGLHWLCDGSFLVCTGADVITAWSFAEAGAGGKPPIEIGYAYDGLVTAVAAHPSAPLAAGGYSTGSILIGGMSKGEALVARGSDGDGITALSWAPDGRSLIAGTAGGNAILVAVPENLGIR